jgi:hypothetical protein
LGVGISYQKFDLATKTNYNSYLSMDSVPVSTPNIIPFIPDQDHRTSPLHHRPLNAAHQLNQRQNHFEWLLAAAIGTDRQPGYKELSEVLWSYAHAKKGRRGAIKVVRERRQQPRDVIRHAILLQPLLIEIIFFFIEV